MNTGHHWQLDEDQGIDYQHYQFHLQSYHSVIILLNHAYLTLFIDLTRSFIQARKLVDIFMEQSLQIGGVWSFYNAMSDREERFLLVKCSRAETFFQS